MLTDCVAGRYSNTSGLAECAGEALQYMPNKLGNDSLALQGVTQENTVISKDRRVSKYAQVNLEACESNCEFLTLVLSDCVLGKYSEIEGADKESICNGVL